MFTLSILLMVVFVIALVVRYFLPATLKAFASAGAAAALVLSVLCFGIAGFTTVPASNVAVVTTLGALDSKTLSEGPHFILPWSSTTDIYLGQQRVDANKADAASKDLQSVHANLSANFVIAPGQALDLYKLNTSLNYGTLFLQPALYDVFKAVSARYTAEELLTKRAEVGSAIVAELQRRMAPYHLTIQAVNLTDFGFSKAFDTAIEEKVTANQRAQTAENNLKRVKFEAEQRIAQAEGEAKAIAIQAAAVEKSGGVGYVQLQAISKWDGKLPQYVTAGAPVPFIGAAAK